MPSMVSWILRESEIALDIANIGNIRENVAKSAGKRQKHEDLRTCSAVRDLPIFSKGDIASNCQLKRRKLPCWQGRHDGPIIATRHAMTASDSILC